MHSFFLVDVESWPLYLSIILTLGSLYPLNLVVKNVSRPGTKIPARSRAWFAALLLFVWELLDGFVYVIAIRNQPIFDWGNVVTVYIPVILFMFSASALLVTSSIAILAFPFMSLSGLAFGRSGIIATSVMTWAFAMAHGSGVAVLLAFIGSIVNIIKFVSIPDDETTTKTD